jgi:uncharacterized OsmC-like protein
MDVEDAVAVPRSPVSVAVTMRGHTLVQDKPPASGGGDEGPMASELLLAALLACQHSTFVKVAAKRRLEAAVRQVQGELEFEGGDIARGRVRFLLETSAPDEAVATALRLTDKACTISKAVRFPIESGYARAPPPSTISR